MNMFPKDFSVYFWPVITLAAVSLHFWFPETPTGLAHDSYSAAAEGQKAFYRLVESQPGNVVTWRNRRPLNILLNQSGAGTVLCLLGPERPPTADEWSAITDWVLNGGQLLYAFRGHDAQEIPGLNVKYIPDRPHLDDLEPRTSLVATEKIAWWTDGKLEAPQAVTLVEYNGTVQAVEMTHGAGKAVVLASTLPVSNQLLTFGDNSILAVRLLEHTGPLNFVVFDESLNNSGTAKIVGILFDPFLRPMTIQIIILTALFGWWRNRRFGPLTPSTVHARQNIVEHTDMVGNWYWKSQDGTAVLRAYLRQLSSQLKLKTFRGSEERVLEPIARRSGRDVASLRKDLQQAFQAVRSKKVDRRTAAKLISRLALIRRDARLPSKK